MEKWILGLIIAVAATILIIVIFITGLAPKLFGEVLGQLRPPAGLLP